MKNKNEVLLKIQEIFIRELEDSSIILSLESSSNNVDKWDSINNLILISSIEETFGISFPLEIIFEAKTIGDLCDFIVSNS